MAHDVTIFWDYIVLGFCIFLNSSVVLYLKFFGPQQKSKKDYVFASESISIPAMILSITRGTLGIRAFLGNDIFKRRRKQLIKSKHSYFPQDIQQNYFIKGALCGR